MENKLFMNRNCKIVDKSGSILFRVVVIHMDAFQSKCIYIILYQNIFMRMIYLIFCVNRDLENKEINLKLEIDF